MAHTSFFFDLDGTITDSKQGIINSVLYSLNHFGIRANADSLLFFIGPPLKQSFARYFPGDSARVALAVEKYREYFRRQGMFENQVYPGVPGTASWRHFYSIQILSAAGCVLRN